ncbi:hypothetical protein MUG84_16180 [Paenibacillus sp. KQZ6P-2]|uniref:Uncharacterized protein n=1 Tax=Paenibacillus mangrovi TaxID=2931978 RepID=A0A9X1WST0_9BACL|nr:hypothetical protein [Paenibacillus mangrovi]MCJ8013270.1 hypothetical protein [Paenibacillus mangrovi]
MSVATGVVALFPLIVFIGFGGLGIACMILFIRFAVRAIKALDIYLAEKSRNKLY